MFDKVMEANNNVKPLLKYTPENFDDIEKESKQNQQQFYNGELLAACHIQYVTNCMSQTVCHELYATNCIRHEHTVCHTVCVITKKLIIFILELANMFEGLGPMREGF